MAELFGDWSLNHSLIPRATASINFPALLWLSLEFTFFVHINIISPFSSFFVPYRSFVRIIVVIALADHSHSLYIVSLSFSIFSLTHSKLTLDNLSRTSNVHVEQSSGLRWAHIHFCDRSPQWVLYSLRNLTKDARLSLWFYLTLLSVVFNYEFLILCLR